MYLSFKFIPHEHGPPLLLPRFFPPSLSVTLRDPSWPCPSDDSVMYTDNLQTRYISHVQSPFYTGKQTEICEKRKERLGLDDDDEDLRILLSVLLVVESLKIHIIY